MCAHPRHLTFGSATTSFRLQECLPGGIGRRHCRLLLVPGTRFCSEPDRRGGDSAGVVLDLAVAMHVEDVAPEEFSGELGVAKRAWIGGTRAFVDHHALPSAISPSADRKQLCNCSSPVRLPVRGMCVAVPHRLAPRPANVETTCRVSKKNFEKPLSLLPEPVIIMLGLLNNTSASDKQQKNRGNRGNRGILLFLCISVRRRANLDRLVHGNLARDSIEKANEFEMQRAHGNG
jgi:hypothetical protein